MNSTSSKALAGICLALTAFVATLPAQFGIKCTNNSTTSPLIQIPYHYTLVPRSGLTVEAWITYDETTISTGYCYPTVIRQNIDPGKESFFLRVNAGNTRDRRLSFAVKTTANTLSWAHYLFAPGELKKWTHVAGTFDPVTVTVKIYVNGVLKATTFTPGTTLVDNGGVTNIGCGDTRVAAVRENWNGEIDEVRLWPFARTANEIKATMNMSLRNVPGGVSTWGLDLIPVDTSGANHGTNVAAPTYTKSNGLALTLVADMGATRFGNGNVGCDGLPQAGVTSYANVGNTDFAFTCTYAVSSINHTGALWVGSARLSSALNFNGAPLWVDVGKPGVLLFVKANVHGLFRLPLKIPAKNALIGAKVYCQYVWDEPTCKTNPVTSTGLMLNIKQ